MTVPKGGTLEWFSECYRLLVVDDNPAIHDDFRKILEQPTQAPGDFELLDEALFASEQDTANTVNGFRFELDVAMQGHDGLALIEESIAAERPYSLVFMDVRMPPGWNGVETAARILRTDPHVQIVLCTAYSDFGWEQIVDVVGATDRVLILKKPFSVIEVQQLGYSLVMKWLLMRASENHRDELEARVEARTQELVRTNERLRQEMAERARMEAQLRKAQRLESLGRLAAGIGHEINNPLNFISGSIEIVHNEISSVADGIPEDRLAAIDEVLDAAGVGIGRIARIVRSIKLFSRSTGDEAESIELADTLAMCVKMSLERLDDDLELKLDFGDVSPVWGDRVELEQIFINLFENAVHAMRDAGVESPCILVVTRSDDDGMIRVEIIDNGPGVPEALVDKVFDPFFTTKAPGVGTGLGLSICHSIIASMGGEISLHNIESGGAAAVVRLPRAASVTAIAGGVDTSAEVLAAADDSDDTVGDAVDDALSNGVPARMTTVTSEPISSERGRVLLIDDEPLMLRVMTHSLREHELTTARSAGEALGYCAERSFDIIFCDVMMPTMNGPAFYQELARLRPGYEQRIVFITGGARVIEIQEFLDHISNDCLAKPVGTDALRARVVRALMQRQDLSAERDVASS